MTDARPQRIGMLGGTFDPVHLGHVKSAEQIARDLDLDRILLVLSARPPHKNETAHASTEDRLAMLRLAVAGTTHLEASDVEIARSGPSYTVDTLRGLAADNPQAELFLILGMDAWLEVDSWHKPEELLTLAHVIVTTRPGLDFRDTPALPPVVARDACWYDSAIGSYVHRSGHRLTTHPIQGIEASSTDIRRRVREGLPFEHLVPHAVARYIHERGLYA
jgi:nicotinate-nucleotide adenylyltransferase